MGSGGRSPPTPAAQQVAASGTASRGVSGGLGSGRQVPRAARHRTATVAGARRAALPSDASGTRATAAAAVARHRLDLNAGAARARRRDADDAELDPTARVRAVGDAGLGVA